MNLLKVMYSGIYYIYIYYVSKGVRQIMLRELHHRLLMAQLC